MLKQEEAQFFDSSCQEGSHCSFYVNSDIFQINQKVARYLGFL